MLRKFLITTAATAVLTGAAMAQDATSDIVDTAVAAGDFTTLVAAVQAAGLADTLKGEGPFTVFAPTDAAFAALPEGTVDTLLKPENKDQLVSILTYHVVPGTVMSSDLTEGMTAATVQGANVTFTLNGGARVNGASITTADIATSNGVIHVIDKVISQAEPARIGQPLEGAGDDRGVRIVRENVDPVGDVDVGGVAAAQHMAEAHPALGRLRQREAERAGLADQPDRGHALGDGRRIRHGGETDARADLVVQQADAVGPEKAHASFPRPLHQTRLPGDVLGRAGLGEARRVDHRRGNAGGDAILKHLLDARAGRGDHRQIGSLGKRAQ